MDWGEQNKYRRILLAEKERILNLTDKLEAHGLDESLKEATGELSAYDNHPADLGDVTFEREKDIALRDNNATFLGMINDALERIEQRTYGTCDRCGEEISKERLEAFPYTTMCLNCKDEVETYDQPRFRPLEEDFLNPPFHRTFTDGTENVVYDGEDAWQEVARYGTSTTPAYMMDTVTDPNDTFWEADEEQGIVGWGDAIIDDGFTEEFADDEHTGQISRYEREEYEKKD